MTKPFGLVTDPTKSVQGFAMYAEFVNTTDGPKRGNIFQMFFTPDGMSETGKYVGAHVYARELSKDKPKRQWRTAALASPLLDDQGQNTPEHRLERVHTGNSVRSTLRNLALYAEIVGEPFFVEVSKKDLEDISNGRPLTKVIYRIGETRKAKGFAELFPESK